MTSKEGDGALEHRDPGLASNVGQLVDLLVLGAESVDGDLWHCHQRVFCMRGHLPSTSHTYPYQKVSPHIAVTEVAMPVDRRGELLNSLNLSQQFSHLKKFLDLTQQLSHLNCKTQLSSILFNFVCTSSGTEMTVLYLTRKGRPRGRDRRSEYGKRRRANLVTRVVVACMATCPVKRQKNPLKNETEKGFAPALCDASL